MKLYKGIGRSGNDFTDGNDMGLIFATDDIDTARYYAGAAGVVSFDAQPSAAIANLNDRETAQAIVDEISRYVDVNPALVDELVNGETESHLDIMDDYDTNFAGTVYEMGYAGVQQDGHYCFFAALVDITNIQEVE